MVDGDGPVEALDFAQDFVESTLDPSERSEFFTILDGRLDPSKGSGYVVDSLWSAIRSVLATSDYESCVRLAISLGNDTDTTACIAGGLAGILYGEQGIPDRWRQALKGEVIVEEMLARVTEV